MYSSIDPLKKQPLVPPFRGLPSKARLGVVSKLLLYRWFRCPRDDMRVRTAMNESTRKRMGDLWSPIRLRARCIFR